MGFATDLPTNPVRSVCIRCEHLSEIHDGMGSPVAQGWAPESGGYVCPLCMQRAIHNVRHHDVPMAECEPCRDAGYTT